LRYPKKSVIFLVGPTACGKSQIAVNLAKKINAEIISCDSMQIYKGMDILTSKPSPCLLKKVKHHLINIYPVSREFNVVKYRRLAIKKIKQIHHRGKIPLFVGGTGFYMSIILDGIFSEKSKDTALRQRLWQEAQRYTGERLYRRLKKIDPLAAARIHPHDLRRVIRALEVCIKTGRPISELQKKRRGIFEQYHVRIFGLKREKADLKKRIQQRVKKMWALGLLEEVRRLLKLPLSRTAGYAIGIREIKGYLNGEYNIAEAKHLIERSTWLYAKRQMTWFKKDKRIEWISLRPKDSIEKAAQKIWKRLF